MAPPHWLELTQRARVAGRTEDEQVPGKATKALAVTAPPVRDTVGDNPTTVAG